MTSREHIVTGLPVCAWLLNVSASSTAAQALAQTGVTSQGASFLAVALIMLGVVLPDCDYKGSLISHLFYLPIEHRTWTHALWFPLVVALVAVLLPPVRILVWLSVGYVVHLAFDACGACGICWFYPYPGYHVYESGARVKRGNHLRLYGSDKNDVGRISLIVLCVVLTVLAFVI
jgi:membrane-bound metal-dependent hydrolase YbcI (DUF457 family)